MVIIILKLGHLAQGLDKNIKDIIYLEGSTRNNVTVFSTLRIMKMVSDWLGDLRAVLWFDLTDQTLTCLLIYF